MTTTETSRAALSEISRPSRVADEGEGVGLDETGLAARNHGMPLELMAHDVTPLGAHYLLTHYDMAKALDRAMILSDIRLLEKSGGRSGDWRAA